MQIREDFQKKKEELEKLQGEQMRLQLMQLEELQLKHDLIKKKQEQERQELIKQQQQTILQMRLQEENITSTEVKYHSIVFITRLYRLASRSCNALTQLKITQVVTHLQQRF